MDELLKNTCSLKSCGSFIDEKTFETHLPGPTELLSTRKARGLGVVGPGPDKNVRASPPPARDRRHRRYSRSGLQPGPTLPGRLSGRSGGGGGEACAGPVGVSAFRSSGKVGDGGRD
jgi:hypothetical protein